MSKIVKLADVRADRSAREASFASAPYDVASLTQQQKHQKLHELADAEGYDSVDDMFEVAVTDTIAPCICLTCGATAGLKADERAGWCHGCDNNHMASCLVLAGLI